MLLDAILPPTLDPNVKLMINILVGLHLLAFVVWMVYLCKSLGKSQTDNF
jgi:hypothetical protein